LSLKRWENANNKLLTVVMYRCGTMDGRVRERGDGGREKDFPLDTFLRHVTSIQKIKSTRKKYKHVAEFKEWPVLLLKTHCCQ